MAERVVLLSFDFEEFDVPCEHGVELPLSKQVHISSEGAMRVLELLKAKQVRATFFCTVQFLRSAPDVLVTLLGAGHEIASHGMYHSEFEESHLWQSRTALQELTGRTIRGYRQARMMPLPEGAVARAGYTYNSSLNPTFIPGRYMHFRAPRLAFEQEGVLQIPAAVTPGLRIPLFWLSCHHFPQRLYRKLCCRNLRRDGYVSLYFHPWEFVNLKKRPELGLPWLITRNSGDEMVKRLGLLIDALRGEGARFATYGEFATAWLAEREG